MNFSGIWNQLLLNPTTVCFQPTSLIEGIQVITPYVTSSDTNSSENSLPIQEDDESNEESNSNEQHNEKSEDVQEKKSIQRVRLEV